MEQRRSMALLILANVLFAWANFTRAGRAEYCEAARLIVGAWKATAAQDETRQLAEFKTTKTTGLLRK